MPLSQLRGRRRGGFGVPGGRQTASPAATHNSSAGNHGDSNAPINKQMQELSLSQNAVQQNGSTTASSASKSSNEGKKGPKAGTVLMAKHSYKANPASPLGQELNLKIGDKLRFLSGHEKYTDIWWLVENNDKVKGYVPAQYVVVHEVKGLPWLQNKQIDAEAELEEPTWRPKNRFGAPGAPGAAEPSGPVYKEYKPTYDHAELKSTRREEPAAAAKSWRCDLCEKDLNGIKPYQAHMASRGHREEVEIAKDMGKI